MRYGKRPSFWSLAEVSCQLGDKSSITIDRIGCEGCYIETTGLLDTDISNINVKIATNHTSDLWV